MDEIGPLPVVLFQLQLAPDGSLHYYVRPDMNVNQLAAVIKALELSAEELETDVRKVWLRNGEEDKDGDH